MNNTTQPTSLAPLYWLALGTFAVGTESFMIAGLLPDIATDLHTSIVATGQLVTVFALAYALSSPILTALTGAFHRRTLMILSLSAFTVANIVAWAAAACEVAALILTASIGFGRKKGRSLPRKKDSEWLLPRLPRPFAFDTHLARSGRTR